MRRVFAFTVGIGFGILACLGATNFHVVRAQDGFHLVKKQNVRLGQAYVDTRQFTAADWATYPELIASLRADNEQGLVNESSPGLLQTGANRLSAVPQQLAR
ncbi:hypothetical protein [Lacipirellula sp.]|uniref:hypothetical protein n=1 Tax=Lacipirellula sp. TaxID=2691419 RepID=UPI003D143157